MKELLIEQQHLVHVHDPMRPDPVALRLCCRTLFFESGEVLGPLPPCIAGMKTWLSLHIASMRCHRVIDSDSGRWLCMCEMQVIGGEAYFDCSGKVRYGHTY